MPSQLNGAAFFIEYPRLGFPPRIWHYSPLMASILEQITASAGSGKTYTLTRRFLEYLAGAIPDGAPSLCMLQGAPQPTSDNAPYSLAGILAATFTNKAAAEMQARVIRELKQQALAKDTGDPDFPLTPEQARRWVRVILRRYDAVNIRTIDSLLNLLVRLNALSLSLPPDFAPLFSPDEAILPLYDILLDRADREPDGDIAALFRNACRSLLFHHRAKGVAAGDILRGRLRELIDLHLSGAPLPTEEDGEKATARLMALHAALTEAASALESLIRDENLAANAHALKFLRNCCECRPLTVPGFADSYAWKDDLDAWLNKASKGAASKSAHAAFHDLCVTYRTLATHGPALVTTREYMPLVALSNILLHGLDEMQREQGVVPATRLPALARESLESGNGVSDAFCRLGDTLVHLLFDEFQDTSTDQWQAILPLVEECLARGGSLTYVGDVKQAIYGWRGGNAELFDAVAQDGNLTAMLENHTATTTILSHNWRSAPAVVHTNNRIFGQLAEPEFARRILEAMLPEATDPALFARTAAMLTASFSGCEQRVPDKNMVKDGYVRLTRIEAKYTPDLMEKVKEELRSLLLEEVLTRRNPGEVAVLVRKNSEAADVSNWLSEWGVPVVTEHSFRLGNHPLITRLVDALTFLEYPMDDAAFWSAASCPELFGDIAPEPETLPETLADWLAETRGQPNAPPLYTAFRKTFPEVWKKTLAPFHDQTGLLSAYDMVCELIRHCRLFERYPAHAPFLRRFAEVAHAAESKGNSSLSAFLDYWLQTGTEERVPMPENMDAVRILSMHKAKGLEFPVVVVPFHHQSDPPFKPLAVDNSTGLQLLAYRDASAAESIRGTVEQINLLYVAWTRPTEELYAFITQSGHSASHSSLGKALETLLEDTPFSGGVFSYGKAPAPEISGTPPQPANMNETPGDSAESPPAEQPGEPDQQSPSPLMSWLPRLKIFRNPMGEKGFSERQRGLLAHACLEALRLTGDGADDTATDVARAVDQGLRAFPVPMPDPEAVRRDMADMLAWYASLPEAAVWMRHGTPEQPIMDADGSLRRVDLLVDVPAAPLLAVEYKTGQPSGDHIVQVERYISLLAQSVRRSVPTREVAGIVVYLDRRELTPVRGPNSVEATS